MLLTPLLSGEGPVQEGGARRPPERAENQVSRNPKFDTFFVFVLLLLLLLLLLLP